MKISEFRNFLPEDTMVFTLDYSKFESKVQKNIKIIIIIVLYA